MSNWVLCVPVLGARHLHVIAYTALDTGLNWFHCLQSKEQLCCHKVLLHIKCNKSVGCKTLSATASGRRAGRGHCWESCLGRDFSHRQLGKLFPFLWTPVSTWGLIPAPRIVSRFPACSPIISVIIRVLTGRGWDYYTVLQEHSILRLLKAFLLCLNAFMYVQNCV